MRMRWGQFYLDQEFGHNRGGMPIAVYTLDPIPPEAISLASTAAAA